MIDALMAEYVAERAFFGLMIWREAAGEPREGKIAVAHTVMNRARHPKWWGRTPYEVIVKKWQYSSMTAIGDPMTIKYPVSPDDRVFAECIQIASDVLDGKLRNPVPGADSYYAISIKPPKWADESKFVKQIGNHRFYNLDGDPGESKGA